MGLAAEQWADGDLVRVAVLLNAWPVIEAAVVDPCRCPDGLRPAVRAPGPSHACQLAALCHAVAGMPRRCSQPPGRYGCSGWRPGARNRSPLPRQFR